MPKFTAAGLLRLEGSLCATGSSRDCADSWLELALNTHITRAAPCDSSLCPREKMRLEILVERLLPWIDISSCSLETCG